MKTPAIRTRDQLRAAKRALKKVKEQLVTVTAIAAFVGVERSAVAEWFRRGYCSALAAIKLGTLPGITKEELRPDVEDWQRIRDQRASYNTGAYARLPK